MFWILRGRHSLLWLFGPLVLFLVALPFVNTPHLLGPWLLGAALLTPLFVLLAARGDPVYRSDHSPDEPGRLDDGR
jgi:hypothetical protein